MDNLRDRSAGNFMPFDGVPGLVRSNWNDGYDRSRILLPDLICRGVGSGNPVIMIPTRETLLLARDHQPAALRDGVDIFFASFGTMQKDGQIQSFCSWTDEVDAMLPRTDVVALARNGPDEQFDMVLVDWQTLSARHGDLLLELPDFPPRYRVSAFPTELFEELLAVKQREAVMQNAR